jgi:hypothetical protein
LSDKTCDTQQKCDEEHVSGYCKNCVCELLSDIVENQRKHEEIACNPVSDLSPSCVSECGDTVPVILQTPYGQPFFTWGKIGTDDCFVTIFFKVVKVDCEKNCAVMQLLKPNKSIIDPETECMETKMICDVDYVTPTKECILIKLNCYNAVKCISCSFVKK